ncbi:sporulation initiation phosphotransferase B [Metabacillus arenae]|uniref:Sporulation initiation phosphotransferase B n=1 Tax=Metabacillus arenae TaxID=2771434 RepID=A0A926NI49_9BACI|nr:sporulation initiation phosphotransferase B [Metabacillus arenae]MBD1381210.1 sporulation initiation phosphotransferase B [Metabacillus arenae]
MKYSQKDWSIVDLLSHSRHDWMNKLQLIKGNLSLNKYERVHKIMEEIVIEAQHESMLSHLNMPEFSCLLMTFNWQPHNFSLEYEVIGKTLDLSDYDQTVTAWCLSFLMTLNDSVEKGAENHLILSIGTSNEKDQIRLFFDFNGTITDKKSLEGFFVETKSAEVSNPLIHDQELSAMVHFK